MKKTFLFKALALLLSAVLLIAPVSLLQVSADVIVDCPEIDVHGFVASPILKDVNDPSKGYVWDWSQEEILNLIKSAIPALGKLALTWNWDRFADEVIPLVENFFEGAIAQPDGTPAEGTGVEFSYPARGTFTKTSKVSFRYDWRADPLEAAAQLNDFINYVCDCTGADQVVLTCHSLGGVVTTSYITLFGDEKLKSVCFNTTAVYGETYTGELLSGKMVLNADAVQYYLESVLGDIEYRDLIVKAVKLFNDVGLLDFICEFGNLILEKLSPRALPELVVPLFAGMPTIWAMVPDEYVDSSIDYVFNTVYKDSAVDRSGLMEKINNYNTQVRAHRDETLDKLNADANVYVISRYGFSSLPITPSFTNMSDSVIDTKFSSFGATTADYGKALSASGEYVSPDRMVDASTCKFPDQTWFIKGLSHAPLAPTDDLVDTLLYTDGQATIHTYERFPQFMTYNADGSLTPTESAPEADLTFLQKIRRFFEELLRKIRAFFAGLN